MTQYTANVGLGWWQFGDANWHLPYQGSMQLLDALAPVGGLAVSLAETPSSSLDVRVAAGPYIQASGAVAAYAGAGPVAVAASAITYLWLTDAGALATGSAWPAGTNVVRLAAVTAGTVAVLSIADARVAFLSAGAPGLVSLPLAGGTMGSGSTIASAGSGFTIAGAASQKLGFWGATPIVQPAGSAQVAIGSLVATAATLTTVGATNSADQSATINANEIAINAQVANAAADLATLKALVNALRSALVAAGLVKGSA